MCHVERSKAKLKHLILNTYYMRFFDCAFAPLRMTGTALGMTEYFVILRWAMLTGYLGIFFINGDTSTSLSMTQKRLSRSLDCIPYLSVSGRQVGCHSDRVKRVEESLYIPFLYEIPRQARNDGNFAQYDIKIFLGP